MCPQMTSPIILLIRLIPHFQAVFTQSPAPFQPPPHQHVEVGQKNVVQQPQGPLYRTSEIHHLQHQPAISNPHQTHYHTIHQYPQLPMPNDTQGTPQIAYDHETCYTSNDSSDVVLAA
jgi:hypothetical protein